MGTNIDRGQSDTYDYSSILKDSRRIITAIEKNLVSVCLLINVNEMHKSGWQVFPLISQLTQFSVTDQIYPILRVFLFLLPLTLCLNQSRQSQAEQSTERQSAA